MKKLNVLSLFDGVSCGRQALKRVGIKVDTYYAAEIEKAPIVATQYNFPDTIQLGDVTKVRAADLKPIDLLIGGSPCQGFSRAGKGLNFDDPRSKLFFEYVRLLKECREINPDVLFLLENVDMDKWCLGVISEHLGLFPVKINSKLVSAQNRERWYWTNIRTREEGFFNEIHADIPQPRDLGIVIRDILQPEEEVDKKYYLSEKALNYLKRDSTGKWSDRMTMLNYENDAKAGAITANHCKGVPYNMLQLNNTDKCSPMVIAQRGRYDENGKIIQQIEPNSTGKCNALTSVEKDNMLLFKKNYLQYGDNGHNSASQRAFYPEGKSGTLVGGSKKSGNIGLQVIVDKNEVNQVNPSTESNGNQPYQQNRVYDSEGKSPAHLAEMSSGTHAIIVHNMSPRSGDPTKGGTGHLTRTDGKAYCLQTSEVNRIEYDFLIRRFTPKEVCRLQTMDDNYFYDKEGKNIISDTQIYKACGNGWTINVIAHIFQYLNK